MGNRAATTASNSAPASIMQSGTNRLSSRWIRIQGHVAPGQNRADNSDNIAAGESDCTGGNDPTSGGNPLVSCSDGSFSNLFSTSLSDTNGPFYITGAYEFIRKSKGRANCRRVRAALSFPRSPTDCVSAIKSADTGGNFTGSRPACDTTV